MNRKISTRRDFHLAALAALVMVACSKPPSELVTQGREAEQTALASGAKEYVPGALDDVAVARAALDAELAAQKERWAVRRSYTKAETLAQAYLEAGQKADRQAVEAKEAARQRAASLITESRTLLGEVRGMLAVAPVGKGSAADLAAMRSDLDAAQAGLDAAEVSMGSELYLEAEAAAKSAREVIDRVKASVDHARALHAG